MSEDRFAPLADARVLSTSPTGLAVGLGRWRDARHVLEQPANAVRFLNAISPGGTRGVLRGGSPVEPFERLIRR